MNKKLYIDPPELLRWLPTELSNDVLFLDLEPDFLDDKTIRIDLNIVFWPIALTRGVFQKRDFYVGTTGARILFRTDKGRVSNYTRATLLRVDHENTYTRSRSATVKISPKIETGSQVKIEGGEVTFDKDAERTFTAKFSGFERELSDTNLGWGVKWDIRLPPGQLIRDYLDGNLYLYVEFSWGQDHREGWIELRASDVLFFDSNRQLITDAAKVLAMRFALVRKGIKVRQALKLKLKEIE